MQPDTSTILQQKIGRYIQTGKKETIADASIVRLEQYRFMILHTVKETLENAFPITHQFLPEKKWYVLVHDFFSKHHCVTPFIWKMPFEFVQFVQQHRYAKKWRMPFLNDLLWFEWLEIDLYMMEDEQPDAHQKIKDVRNDRLVFYKEHIIARFDYPVHLVSPAEAAQKKGEYYLLIFRQPKTGKLEFLHLSKLYAWLLFQLSVEEKTLNECMNVSGVFFDTEKEKEQFIASTEQFIHQLIRRKCIAGKKINS